MSEITLEETVMTKVDIEVISNRIVSGLRAGTMNADEIKKVNSTFKRLVAITNNLLKELPQACNHSAGFVKVGDGVQCRTCGEAFSIE